MVAARARAFRAVVLMMTLWTMGRGMQIWWDGQQPASSPNRKMSRQPSHIASETRGPDGPEAPFVMIAPKTARSWVQTDQKPSKNQPISEEFSELFHFTPMPRTRPHLPLALSEEDEILAPTGEHRKDLLIARRTRRSASISSWALIRPGQLANPAAPAGQYGGSQIGVRARLPVPSLPPSVAVSARLSGDTPHFRETEMALGIGYRPIPNRPLEIIAEARLPFAQPSRPRPALIATTGWHVPNRPPPGAFQGYVQAGVVGLNQPVFFADGAMALRWGTGRNSAVGAGLWGGAQAGASRVDIGPSLQVMHQATRLSVDWRIRIAGNARPGSGPSLTLGKDF